MATAAALVVGGVAVIRANLRVDAPEGPIRLTVAMEQPGDEGTYRMTMMMDGTWTFDEHETAVKSETSADLDYRILSVDSDGTLVGELNIYNIEVSVNGRRDSSVPPSRRLQIRATRDGRIIEAGDDLETAGSTGEASDFEDLFPSLPDQPVAPGDEWDIDGESPFPLGEGTITEAGVGRFLRYEKVNGVATAVIETEVTTVSRSWGGAEMIAALTGDSDIQDLHEMGVDFLFEAEDQARTQTWIDFTERQMIRARSESSGRWQNRPRGVRRAGIPTVGFEGVTIVSLEIR